MIIRTTRSLSTRIEEKSSTDFQKRLNIAQRPGGFRTERDSLPRVPWHLLLRFRCGYSLRIVLPVG